MLENRVQNQTMLRLGALDNLLMMRNSVGAAKHYDERTARRHVVTYGLGTGSPDLVCILHVDEIDLGVWFCIETKRTDGVARKKQLEVHQAWRAFGALVYVADSPEEAEAALDDALRTIRAKLHAYKAAP